MNENIDLCELLKGHEGETFYSTVHGNVRLDNANSYRIEDFPIEVSSSYSFLPLLFTKNGRYRNDGDGECILFPSKDQRDWNKWAEEQKTKAPKTWSELLDSEEAEYMQVTTSDLRDKLSPIEKSALALLKLYQLIEIGYGGIPTKEERMDEDNCLYTPDYDGVKWRTLECYLYIDPIAFYTEEQCKEFLSYPENVQLLKDFYML